jgi:hypothetical protein
VTSGPSELEPSDKKFKGELYFTSTVFLLVIQRLLLCSWVPLLSHGCLVPSNANLEDILTLTFVLLYQTHIVHSQAIVD